MLMQQGFGVVWTMQWIILALASLLVITVPIIVLTNKRKFANMQVSWMPVTMMVFSVIINLLVIAIISVNYAQGFSYPFAWFNTFIWWFVALLVN